MTNFAPLKLKIWNSARADNWNQFNKDCDVLIEKVVGDWWRIGWSLDPANLDELYQLLDKASEKAHNNWLKAIEDGDAPAEDISPGEGFLLVKKVIKEAVEGKSKIQHLNG